MGGMFYSGKLWAVVIAVLLSSLPHFAEAEDEGERMRLVELGSTGSDQAGAVLLYREGARTIELLRRKGESLEQHAYAAAPGRPAAAVWWNGGSLIAAAFEPFDQGPIRIVLLDQALKVKEVIFEARSSRPDVLSMLRIEDKLFVNMFESKYLTRTGSVVQTAGGGWEFQELFRTRMGMYVDWMKDGSVVVGRPYRDPDDQSVELRVRRRGKWVDLPSLRGVSAVAVFDADGDSQEEILFADGWHQNYGVYAEPRLSLLDCTAEFERCALRHLDTLEPQDRLEKIRPVNVGGRLVVLVHGGQYVDTFYPQQNWKHVRLHTRKSKNLLPLLDFAVLDWSEEGVFVAILDGDAPILKRAELPEHPPPAQASGASPRKESEGTTDAAFFKSNLYRCRGAIVRARAWLDNLQVDPFELRAAGLKGKKKLVEILDAYVRLYSLAVPNDKPALLERINEVSAVTFKPEYHDMGTIGELQFKQDATSYLRAAYLMESVGLDTELYRNEIRRILPRLNQHMQARGSHQRMAFHWYYRHFGLAEPFDLASGFETGVVATRLDPYAYSTAQAYQLTHEIFVPYEYGAKLDVSFFSEAEHAYLRRALERLAVRYIAGRDPDLVAELVTCLRYLRITDSAIYREGIEFLLSSQHADGKWGGYESYRGRYGKLVDQGWYLHTTIVALEALSIACEAGVQE